MKYQQLVSVLFLVTVNAVKMGHRLGEPRDPSPFDIAQCFKDGNSKFDLLPCSTNANNVRNGEPLRTIPEIVFNASNAALLNISLREVRATLFNVTLRTYCDAWNTSLRDPETGDPCGNKDAIYVSGPLIRFKAGQSYDIGLLNNLGPDTPNRTIFQMAHANTTNFHLHGLHVSPAQDNVVRHVYPEAKSPEWYHYDIPENHLPGTHWYHAHQHGSSSLQVMSGLVGPIIVEQDDYQHPLQQVWSDIPSTLLMLHHLQLCTCICSMGQGDGVFNMHSLNRLRGFTGDLSDPRASIRSDDVCPSVYLTNGQYQPVLTGLYSNKWHRFEIIHSVGGPFVELLVTEDLNSTLINRPRSSPKCTMLITAFDGVFLYEPREEDDVLLAPGGRVSLLVRCAEAGEYYLRSIAGYHIANVSNPYPDDDDDVMKEYLPVGNATFSQNMLTLRVDPLPPNAIVDANISWTYEQMAKTFPDYLTDLAANDTAPLTATPWEININVIEVNTEPWDGFDFIGVGTNCTLGPNLEAASPTCAVFPFGFNATTNLTSYANNSENINTGVHHNMMNGRTLAWYPYRHVSRVCDIEELVIHGGQLIPHPIHFHTNHFQIVSVRDEKDPSVDASNNEPFVSWGRLKEWRDTVPAFDRTMTIRYRLSDFSGLVMYHCHFLAHEDFGMMDRWWVNPKSSGGRCTATQRGVSSNDFCNSAIDPNLIDAAFNDYYPSTVTKCPSLQSSSVAGSGVAVIVGGVLGAIVVLGLGIVFVVLWLRKRRAPDAYMDIPGAV